MRLPTFAPARRASYLRVTAAVVLLLGYADLVHGGSTAAPILIVIGYTVLVPAVILAWR